MATSTRLSLLEYMKTSYRPDREYVDGEPVHWGLVDSYGYVSCAGDSDLGQPAEALCRPR